LLNFDSKLVNKQYGAPALASAFIAVLLVGAAIPSSFAAISFKTFDGSEKVDVAHAAKQQLAKFTVEVRFRIQDSPAEKGFLVSKKSSENGNNGNDQNYALFLTASQKVSGGFKATDDSFHYITSPNTVSLNAWHIAILTYDGNQLKLQVDGDTVATKNVNKNADNAGTGPLRIGANANVLDNFFVGDVDYVKVINQGTSASVYSNTFGNGSPPPLPSGDDCSDIPIKNFRGVVFVDKILGRDESGGGADAPNYVSESMDYIASNGFNAVRVPFYWESFVFNPTQFMNEIELVIQEAEKNDICVILDNHHFYTSSHWNLEVEGKSDGRGFPSFVVEDFPKKNNDYIQTAGPFWNAFLSNTIMVDGEKVWDVQWEFLSGIINAVDDSDAVAGYEILNEPHLFQSAHYDKLGDYNTFMAQKIRSISDKKIFFDRETTRGFQREPSMELRIFPDGVSGVVYAPHLYSVPTPGSQGDKQMNNFKTWSTQRGTEVLIGEWGADTQGNAVTFMNKMKSNDFGWTAHSWKKAPSGGLGHSLYESSTSAKTQALQILVAAMNAVY
jgi:hypothetical protein